MVVEPRLHFILQYVYLQYTYSALTQESTGSG